MTDHAYRPPTTAPVHVVIAGRIDPRGHHDGSQVHLPAACTDRGEVWITPRRISFVDPDAPSDTVSRTDHARAVQDAAMHQRHAAELRAELISIGDAIIRAVQALAAGAANPLSELRQWSRGLQLTGAESNNHNRDDHDLRAEVTCTLTGAQPLQRLEAMAAEFDITPDELASALVTAALTGAPRRPTHLTSVPG